eukprot:10513557-Alexandrium_andersonii.AAC.1
MVRLVVVRLALALALALAAHGVVDRAQVLVPAVSAEAARHVVDVAAHLHLLHGVEVELLRDQHVVRHVE